MSDDRKITITELEALLSSNDELEIRINPDGSITAEPKPPAKTADILAFVRREPSNY